jgi:eukaryotic-like serine/threonine-protein kinase
MTFAIGSRVGLYEILSPLGAGGMGEVYRARDTKLGRDVAVKVLPSSLADDSDRLHRFEQEACAAGALNHPNILVIHHVDKHEGAPYIVSELLDGETLRKRMSGAKMAQRRAIDYALQIAHGLAAAHEKGIVHRDLKPDNIFITKDGRLKILDFGLAKLTQPDGTQPQTEIPTRRVDTNPGVVMGTVGYMSPEQVRGQPVDHRSDIFSFGAILYEMLSGRRAFHGQSSADTMSAILKEDPPDLSETNKTVSPALERLVNHCLEKNPEARFHSARDLAFAIEALSGSIATSTETISAPVMPRRRVPRRELISWLLVSLFLLVIAGLAIVALRKTPTNPAQLSRFYVYPAEKTSFAGAVDFISPDGRKLIFNASDADGKTQLWIRSIDSLSAQPIPGTEQANQAFWSPDSQFIGFFAGGKLKKAELSSGAVQTLADTQVSRGGTWNRDGVIVFASSFGGSLVRTSATGGAITPATTLDTSRRQSGHYWPHFLPDSRHFIYLARGANKQDNGIYVGSLDSTDSKLLVQTDAGAMYAAPGYLLFLRERTLMAQPFDPEKLQLTGEPSVIAEQLVYNPSNGRAFFCVSDNGILVYRTGAIAQNTRPTWYDRRGKELGSLGGPESIIIASALSPDETKFAISRTDPNLTGSDIWILDTSGRSSRLTFDPAVETNPIWSPDGTRIVFSSNRLGPFDLYWKFASGAGNEELLLKSDNTKFALDWSADGQFVLYQDIAQTTQRDLWALPLFGDKKPIAVVQTNFNEAQGNFSPDGHWVAYVSDESGTSQVYVQNFPPAGGKWMVSINGGSMPRWRRDGNELFYIASNNKLMAVPVMTNGQNFEAGNPQPLFDVRVSPALTGATSYSVTRDGQRFLVNVRSEEASASPAVVVQNWTGLLKK